MNSYYLMRLRSILDKIEKEHLVSGKICKECCRAEEAIRKDDRLTTKGGVKYGTNSNIK